jgi:hypothetical protein
VRLAGLACACGLAAAVSIIEGCTVTEPGYLYHVTTDNCNCDEYHLTDKEHHIEYRFSASYRMDHGIITTVNIEFVNNSRDTLFLDPGMVRISSRNISYRYNNKFIPLPYITILPGDRDHVDMTGTDVAQEDDWHKIAGEQLSVTLRSIRHGDKILPERTVVFVPVNPKIGQAP